MYQPWNPNVSPEGRVLGAYAGFAAALGLAILFNASWPGILLAAIPLIGAGFLFVASWKAGRAVVDSWTEGESPLTDTEGRQIPFPKDPFLGRVARLTGLFAIGASVLLVLFASYDYYDSHRRPHEHATVIAETRIPSACTNGHQVDPQYKVTWRSDNPPRGLAAVFTQDDSCTFYAVGHSETIIRRQRRDGSTYLEVSPLDSVTDEVLLVGAGTLLSVPLGGLFAIWRISRKPKARADR